MTKSIRETYCQDQHIMVSNSKASQIKGERYSADDCRERLNKKSVVRIAIFAAAGYSDDKYLF